MIDFNIGDKAVFEQKTIELSVNVKPGLSETCQQKLGEAVFCLEKIAWSYSVDSANAGDYGWPKTPQRITLADVFSDKTGSPHTFLPPKLLRSIDVHVANPAGITVITKLVLEGTLVTPKVGEVLPSDEEILSYVSLDPSQRGLLALNGAMLFQMNQQYAALVGSEKRALPTEEPKALSTDSLDDDILKSLLIGDLVTCGLSKPLESDTLQQIAEGLLAKGWKRG